MVVKSKPGMPRVSRARLCLCATCIEMRQEEGGGTKTGWRELGWPKSTLPHLGYHCAACYERRKLVATMVQTAKDSRHG